MASDTNGYRKPRLMRELEVEYWHDEPVEVLEHRISGLFDVEIRIDAAIKRCSSCYPFNTKLAYRRRIKGGTFEDWVHRLHDRIAKDRPITKDELSDEELDRDENGATVFLSFQDLAAIVAVNGLPMDKGNLGRGIRMAREKGLVAEDFPYYCVPKPDVIPPNPRLLTNPQSLSVLTTDAKQLTVLVVGDLVVSIDNEKADPEVVRKLQNIRTDYLKRLSGLREEVRTATKSLSTEDGILIGNKKSKEEGKKGEEGTPSPAAPPASPSPVTAVAVSEPEREEAWQVLCAVLDGCGKPVSPASTSSCRAEFFRYSLPDQKRIVEDACCRAELLWNEPKWTPDLLDHLKSRIWDLKPVKRRTLPANGNGSGHKNDAARRNLERAIERDRQREQRT